MTREWQECLIQRHGQILILWFGLKATILIRQSTCSLQEIQLNDLLDFSLDVFAGQKTIEVTDALKSINRTISFIPGGTTGFIQVCDTAINKALKDRIKELVDIYIDQNEERWVAGKFTVGDRRVLLTKWVGQAWEEMYQEDGDMIRQAFEQVGLGLPVDGSQDYKIKIKDFPKVQVGDWQSWRLLKVEGEATEELISLTLTEVEKLAMEALANDVNIELEYDDNDYIIVDV